MNAQLLKIRGECNGVCQLCGTVVSGLVCDHDHITELARGFVCESCNRTVIPAGELRPMLVSERVRSYLSNPPLTHLSLRYQNPPPRKPYFGNWVGRKDSWYKEAFYIEGWNKEVLFAWVVTQETSTAPYRTETTVTYVNKKGEVRHAMKTEESLGEEDLMKLILKNRRSGIGKRGSPIMVEKA